MERLLLNILALLALCVASKGRAAVVLEWDPNTEANVAGYRVYRGTEPRSYKTSFDAGIATAFTNDFPLGLHYLAVTAYDRDGLESDFSDELALQIVPPPTPLLESNALTWAGAGVWQIRWATASSTNRQIVFTNHVPLGMFPAGQVSVRRFELGATNVLSDYSTPLFFNPPKVAGAVRVRVVLQKAGNLNGSFVDFSEASFFDEATDQAFYRARLEITGSGPRPR
jgi:hypothetical protein